LYNFAGFWTKQQSSQTQKPTAATAGGCAQ